MKLSINDLVYYKENVYRIHRDRHNGTYDIEPFFGDGRSYLTVNAVERTSLEYINQDDYDCEPAEPSHANI